ncbi:hypothetical protein LTR08_001378 [Meristemomyces frigidus]|nr:hypothetical protein LTR08_001378 [Meristemomyces frigidus]
MATEHDLSALPWALPLPHGLSNTIEDAMQVTVKLQLDYLWVDALCVPQVPSVNAEKALQIGQMDKIYRAAELVMLAASSKSATGGIPGVSSRSVDNIARVVGGIRVGIGQPLFEEDYEDYFVKSFGWYSNDDSIFITLEYLHHGDLQQCLNDSPLPEQEGRSIVFQTLEGVSFMHENRFAHRDLKPANILVVRRGPDWWVKIADFGISKRATEGLTALRTAIYTPAFVAPEVLGYIQTDDLSDGGYTHAVDIWSLGVIAFLIVTGETYFKDQRRLVQYALGRLIFPVDTLRANSVSASGCDFIRSSMASEPKDRPTVEGCLQHTWFIDLDEADDQQQQWTAKRTTSTKLRKRPALPTTRDDSSTINTSFQSDPEPSASWTTEDQSAAHTASSPGIVKIVVESTTQQAAEVPLPADTQITIHWAKVKKLKGHTKSVQGVAFSPDGRLVVSGSGDKTIRFWDVATGAEVKRLQSDSLGSGVYGVAFSPDGRLVASGSFDGVVRLWDIWDVASGPEVKRLVGHTDLVRGVAFSPDGLLVASGSDDGTIRLWDIATGAEVERFQGHTRWVRGVAFSPDGRLVASVSDDQTIPIRFWDVASRAEVKRLKGLANTEGLAFSPDSRLVGAGLCKIVQLWDAATGAEVMRLVGHTSWVHEVAFSPDGRLVVSGSEDKTIRLWDAVTGKEIKRLEGCKGEVWGVAFSPDGRLVASASDDKTVRLWDLATAENALDHPLRARFSKLFS